MTNSIPVGTIKKLIAHLILISYRPQNKVDEFLIKTSILLNDLAKQAGLKREGFMGLALHEACTRIAVFHQVSREPDPEMVSALEQSSRAALAEPGKLAGIRTAGKIPSGSIG